MDSQPFSEIEAFSFQDFQPEIVQRDEKQIGKKQSDGIDEVHVPKTILNFLSPV